MFNYTQISEQRKESLFKQYEFNTIGTDYIVGDIHGCFTTLSTALEKLGFNPNHDRVFMVGDLVDRGPESPLVFDYLNKPWFHSTMGNHEYFSLMFLSGELDGKTLSKYGGEWLVNNPDLYRDLAISKFSVLPVAIEVFTPMGKIGIVHGDVQSKCWNEYTNRVKAITTEAELDLLINDSCLLRERIRANNTEPIDNLDYLVHGHTVVPGPRLLGNVIYLDTGVVYGNYLTILNTRTQEVKSFSTIDLETV